MAYITFMESKNPRYKAKALFPALYLSVLSGFRDSSLPFKDDGAKKDLNSQR